MKSLITRACIGFTAAFAVTPLLVSSVYPNGMTVGFTQFDAEWTKILIPLVTAIVTAFFPAAAPFVQRILDILKRLNVLQSSGNADVASIAAALQQAEMYLAQKGCTSGVRDCANLRMRLYETAYPKPEPEPNA